MCGFADVRAEASLIILVNSVFFLKVIFYLYQMGISNQFTVVGRTVISAKDLK